MGFFKDKNSGQPMVNSEQMVTRTNNKIKNLNKKKICACRDLLLNISLAEVIKVD